MRISCDLCNYSCHTFTAWIQHLLTPDHQIKTQPTVEGWDKDLVMVLRPRSPALTLGVTPPELIWHYSSYGLVSDIYFDPAKDMKYCFIQFDEPAAVEGSIKENESKTNGKPLLATKWAVTSRNSLRQLGWNATIAAPATFGSSPAPSSPARTPTKSPTAQAPPTPPVKVTTPLIPVPAPSSGSSNKREATPKPARAHSSPQVKPKSPAKKPEKPPDYFTTRHVELERHYDTSGLDIDQQIAHWTQIVTLNAPDMQRRSVVLADLQRLLETGTQGQSPPVLYPFGSHITGLGDKNSDLDVFVDYGPATGSKESLLTMTRNLLRGRRTGWPRHGRTPFYKIIAITNTRVPIIKATHSSGIEVDVSFENITSVRNSELVAFYQEFDPRVKALMLLIRYWGKFHRLTGSSLVKNYALVLLVIVYLARRGLAPSVAALQGLCPPLLVDDWNVAFSTDMSAIRAARDQLQARGILDPLPLTAPTSAAVLHPEISPLTQRPTARSVLALAADFFTMYAALDYSRFVICSLTGEFLERSHFEPGHETQLPEALNRYAVWASDPERDKTFDSRAVRAFCLQDPFQLDFNVGCCVREELLKEFVKCCRDGAERAGAILQQAVKGHVRLFSLFAPCPRDKLSTHRKKKKWNRGTLAWIVNGIKSREQKMKGIRLFPRGFSCDALSARFGLGGAAKETMEMENAVQEKLLALWCMFVKEFFVALLRDGYKMRVNVREVVPRARVTSQGTEEEDDKSNVGQTEVQKGAEGRQGRKRPLPVSVHSSHDSSTDESTKSALKHFKMENSPEEPSEILDNGRNDAQTDFTLTKLRSLLASLDNLPTLGEQTRFDTPVTVLLVSCHPHFNQNYGNIAEQLRAETIEQGAAAVGGGDANPLDLEGSSSLRAIGRSDLKGAPAVSFEIYGRLQVLKEKETRQGRTPFFSIEVPESLFCCQFLVDKYNELLSPYLEYRVRKWILCTD